MSKRQQNSIFKTIKEKTSKQNCKPDILFPVKLSFKTEGKTKTFIDQHRLRKFITHKPVA